MYKYLVVAVDGSETAGKALQHACALAKLSQAKLKLVHVANPTEYLALSPGFLQESEYETAAKEHGSQVLAEAAKLAEEAGVAEVGTHGRSGLMHLLMGSFTETVMRQTKLPLLVIRSNDDAA